MRRRRPSHAGASAAVLFAVLAALVPLTTLIVPTWAAPVALAVGAVTGTGLLRRWVPVWATIVLQAAAALVASAVAFPLPVLGGLVPWPGSAWAAPSVVMAAVDQLIAAFPPVIPEAPLSFVLVSAAAVLALLVDLVAVSARLPLLAVLPLAAVLAAPQLAVPSGDDLLLSVPLAVAALLLLATSRSRRSRRRGRVPLWGASAGGAVVALVVATAVAPRIPAFPPTGSAVTAASLVNVSLDLGDDLRRVSSAEVMRVRTTAPSAPYLRLATHTRFDEDGWHLDDGGLTRSLAFGLGAFEEPRIGGEEVVMQRRTWISDVVLDVDRLPVPANAVDVSGAAPGWQAMLDNRTVISDENTAEGETYAVENVVVSATTDQLNMSPWVGSAEAIRGAWFADEGRPSADAAREVGDEVAYGAVGRAAREATADAETPYQALADLERWLRSSAFSYSLQAPVREGYDGSDLAAVEAFLEMRSGYCQHFASAFALMARSIGIPTRIAVGYLPGEETGQSVDDHEVYSVAADRLHAWPEAYLLGIGWVAFEPTPSIASAQAGAETSEQDETDEPEQPEEQTQSPEPTEEPSGSASPDDEVSSAADSEAPAFGPLVLLAVVLALAAAVCAPRLVRRRRRAIRLRAAGAGDAAAAWQEVRDAAIDAGWDVDASESPRAFGDRMVIAGADAEAMGALVGAIERASFARDAESEAGLDAALRAFAQSLPVAYAGGSVRRWLLPRSLRVRPRLGGAPGDG